MENTNTELASKTGAFFSWIEFLGLILFIVSRLFWREHEWLTWTGFLLLFAGYGYKMYRDWRANRKKAFRNRLFFLFLAIGLALLVGYLAGKSS